MKRERAAVLIVVVLAIGFALVAPRPAEAAPHMGGRVTMVLSPGLEKGVEYGLGGELGWYSDKTWTLVSVGGSWAYNPWQETFPMTDYLNVVQGVLKWLAIGVSGFIYMPFPQMRVCPGVVGIIDFIIKDFDIALTGGAMWSPKAGPALGIQFGYNFTII